MTVETNVVEASQSQATPRKPDVATFKAVVARHCNAWSVRTVEDLCTSQAQAYIDELFGQSVKTDPEVELSVENVPAGAE